MNWMQKIRCRFGRHKAWPQNRSLETKDGKVIFYLIQDACLHCGKNLGERLVVNKRDKEVGNE